MAKKTIICDVDGTIALMKGKRTPFEYHKADQDEPNVNVINVVKELASYNKYHIVFLSARENKDFSSNKSSFNNTFDLTKKWIEIHVFDRLESDITWDLILRKKGDWRTDWVVKYEIYREQLENHYNIQYIFDDRDQVVKMWRDIGFTCFQVAFGNF